MSDYIVKDTELTSVANAIRTKGGTNSQLVFPNGFVSAIGNISGGGGNPNTVETVSGTLANPFGNIDLTELATALASKDATAYLDINASALGVGTISSKPSVNGSEGNIYITGSNIEGNDVSAYNITWNASGELIIANMFMGGNVTSILPYEDNLTTTLTVVWHPLP